MLVVSRQVLVHVDAVLDPWTTVPIECIHRVVVPNLWSLILSLVNSLDLMLWCTSGEFLSKTPRVSIQVSLLFIGLFFEDDLVLGVLEGRQLDLGVVDRPIVLVFPEVKGTFAVIVVVRVDNIPLVCIFNRVIEDELIEGELQMALIG